MNRERATGLELATSSFEGREVTIRHHRRARESTSDYLVAGTAISRDEKTDLVDPAVDPKAEARVHNVDPGFASRDSEGC